MRSHGSELNTNKKDKLLSGRELRVLDSCENVLQKPLSRPTEKQLLSWLKAIARDTGPMDSSIAGLVFIAVERRLNYGGR